MDGPLWTLGQSAAIALFCLGAAAALHYCTISVLVVHARTVLDGFRR